MRYFIYFYFYNNTLFEVVIFKMFNNLCFYGINLENNEMVTAHSKCLLYSS